MSKPVAVRSEQVRPQINGPELARYADRIDAAFEQLPLVEEGQSKIVRLVDKSTVAVRLKPTVHTYAFKRTGEIPGIERLRLKASMILWQLLLDHGLPVAVTAASERCYICHRVDAPPIEVIVKAYHVGTPSRLYRGMSERPTRAGELIRSDCPHPPYVRFDWRNPFPERDECLPVELADRFIDTAKAKRLALDAFSVLNAFFAKREMILQDICLFIDCGGDWLFGEISPDCMRVKYRGCAIDKDLWRSGKSEAEVLRGWTSFLELISA
jgi:phosphoribosylaminoimidazole-succinocarboxamide synthase